jgi:FtsP/CotA-like multicopper oxidase with cupredoxin domain
MMRVLLLAAALNLPFLPAQAAGSRLADLSVADGGKQITIIAKRGETTVDGFGKIAGAYLYSETFTAERSEAMGTPSAQQTVEGLAPPVWHLERGEKLRVTLQNRLAEPTAPCDGFRTNLHTHGLLVAPWTPQDSPFHKLGDFIFAETVPDGCAREAIGGHAQSTAEADYEILIPKEHPSGLFWYHPHPHGLSRKQVMGGMAGLIAVGQLSDYVHIACADGPGPSCPGEPALPNSPPKYLLLRDMQVRTGLTAGAYTVVDEPDSKLCAGDPTKPKPPENPAGRPGKCTSADGSIAWLFPVDGQLHPQDTVPPDGKVWRIGNTSANVTYRLALQDGAQNNLCMQMISRDGVPVATPPTDVPDGVRSRTFESEIILMPGSRVEVYLAYEDALNQSGKRLTVSGSPCGGKAPGPSPGSLKAEFVTLGFDTGVNTDPTVKVADMVGDPWPAIQLVAVELQPPTASGASPQLLVSSPLRTAPAVGTPLSSLRARLTQDLAAMPSVTAAGAPPPPGPVTKCGLGTGGTAIDPTDADPSKGEVRVIWFAVSPKNETIPTTLSDRDPATAAAAIDTDPTSSTFELATEIRNAEGVRLTQGDVKLKVFGPERTDICVRAGHREVWRLVNASNETHNFHIHQSKFRVLTVHDPLNQLRHEAPWAIGPDQAHDVYPIPAFGYVDIEIGFGLGRAERSAPVDPVDGLLYDASQAGGARPVQVGRFVFHCHILEHEDGGMMGVIEVLPQS